MCNLDTEILKKYSNCYKKNKLIEILLVVTQARSVGLECRSGV